MNFNKREPGVTVHGDVDVVETDFRVAGAPDAIALVLVHICLGGFMFILTRKWLQRRDTVTEGNALMHRAGS
ncbi:hypothetical protein [Arthrobacter sp. ZGTC212]|uniref:hypothetical protein n=1 Tax=Arthrobacter sp. ZGTC212 TaxID=2058899 RepID=UPI002157B3C3|nr:hypothetical protein [Arthrobacter sp. ZGTC212]